MNGIPEPYRTKLRALLGEKDAPNDRETALFSRTAKYLRFCAWIPGLRMVAVSNSLAMFATHEDSDIDLFVVSDPRRLWIVRVFLTAAFVISGSRTAPWRETGRFCLSFFASTDALDMEKVAIPDDYYLMRWCQTLKPVLDFGKTHEAFERANEWAGVSAERSKNAAFLRISGPQKTERFPWLWNALEQMFSRLLTERTRAKNAECATPWSVVVSDDMLKFHRNDPRERIREAIN